MYTIQTRDHHNEKGHPREVFKDQLKYHLLHRLNPLVMPEVFIPYLPVPKAHCKFRKNNRVTITTNYEINFF